MDLVHHTPLGQRLKKDPLTCITRSEISHNQLEERAFYYYSLT